MKTLVKLALVLVLFALCVPANGEILVYSKIYHCWEAWEVFDDGVGWAVDEWTQKGFLVLDVEYYQGEIVAINSAEQIEYWRGRVDGEIEKWYWQIKEDFIIERVDIGDEVIWVIEEVEAEEAVGIVMLRGKARNMNIGLGRDNPREVARVLNGYIMYIYLGEGIDKAMCTMSLRLHCPWTKLANNPDGCDQDFECAVFDIVKAWLERRGYQED
jgi:hypothetical protein